MSDTTVMPSHAIYPGVLVGPLNLRVGHELQSAWWDARTAWYEWRSVPVPAVELTQRVVEAVGALAATVPSWTVDVSAAALAARVLGLVDGGGLFQDLDVVPDFLEAVRGVAVTLTEP